jgi:hypothetical protein
MSKRHGVTSLIFEILSHTDKKKKRKKKKKKKKVIARFFPHKYTKTRGKEMFFFFFFKYLTYIQEKNMWRTPLLRKQLACSTSWTWSPLVTEKSAVSIFFLH